MTALLELEGIMLSEIYYVEKKKFHGITYT